MSTQPEQSPIDSVELAEMLLKTIEQEWIEESDFDEIIKALDLPDASAEKDAAQRLVFMISRFIPMRAFESPERRMEIMDTANRWANETMTEREEKELFGDDSTTND